MYDSQFPLASSRFCRESIQYRDCQGHQDPSKESSYFSGNSGGKLQDGSHWLGSHSAVTYCSVWPQGHTCEIEVFVQGVNISGANPIDYKRTHRFLFSSFLRFHSWKKTSFRSMYDQCLLRADLEEYVLILKRVMSYYVLILKRVMSYPLQGYRWPVSSAPQTQVSLQGTGSEPLGPGPSSSVKNRNSLACLPG
jgi:hypothetical protein